MQQLPWLRQVPSHFDGTTCHAGCPTLKKSRPPSPYNRRAQQFPWHVCRGDDRRYYTDVILYRIKSNPAVLPKIDAHHDKRHFLLIDLSVDIATEERGLGLFHAQVAF